MAMEMIYQPEFHCHSFMLKGAQPMPLIFIEEHLKWFALRDYQKKAVFDFMDSEAIGSLLDINKLGFIIPHQLKKKYVYESFKFNLVYKDIYKILQKTLPTPEQNPDAFSKRQSWKYHHLYLEREDGTQSLIMGFPQKLSWEELNSDPAFAKYGKIDESVQELYEEPKPGEKELIYIKGLLD
jgi:hypothetical protein